MYENLATPRHDINDNGWEKIKPHTIEEKGIRGGNAKATRQFINGVFWILRTGAPERLGEICLQNTAIGKMFIADFAAGETKEYGKYSSRTDR